MNEVQSELELNQVVTLLLLSSFVFSFFISYICFLNMINGRFMVESDQIY